MKLQVLDSIEIAKHTLLLGGIILALGTVTGLLAQKAKIPDVAVFPIVGMVIGPHALGLIDIKADSALNQIILLFGASYILFDGGASLRFKVLQQVWITIVVLATVGVVMTAALTGVAAYYVLGVPSMAAALLGTTLASTDPATLVPIFQQVKIRDRVAQTVVSESALNDATGAITTFAVLALAMANGEFSLTASLVDLLKQMIVGIIAGAALGYLAALLIAHERWGFLAEYAPVVTLAAVIGAYLAAEGLQASGFTAVFVFGIVLGNQSSFGFSMKAGDAQRLHEYVTITSFIMRLFIFILFGAKVDFGLNGSIPGRRHPCGSSLHVGRPATDRVLLCAAGPASAVELERNGVHVLDPRDWCHSGCSGRPLAWYEGAGRPNDCIGHLHRCSYDNPDTGAHDKMAGEQAGTIGGKAKATAELKIKYSYRRH